MIEPAAPSRLDRRKARTRAALVQAGRELLATRDPAGVSIQEITDTADVGFGSFYNHFDTKADLFDAAVHAVLEEHAALFDAVTAGLHDPAEVFAASLRMTARLPKTHPEIAQVMQRTGFRYLTEQGGLATRARRDIEAARRAGRFDVADPAVALACVGGALLGALHLATLDSAPGSVDRHADELAVNLLRMLGMPLAEAREVAARPLPGGTGAGIVPDPAERAGSAPAR